MLINLRNALMAGKRLPYDAEVEYLESTGTQWIDTGYTFNSASDKVELVFELLTTTPNYKWIFGAYDASKRLAIGSGDNADRRTFGYNASTSYNSSTYYTDSAHIFLADSAGASIDGQNFFGFADFSTTSHILLYTIPLDPSAFCSNARIWSYKHYRNNVLVRDFIPVRRGSVGYLYDRVSGKLFGNAGTGDFVLGPDVVPVEWLGSDGNQYIDTGFIPDDTCGMLLDVQPLNKSNTVQAGCRSASNGRWWLNLTNNLNVGWNTSTSLGANGLLRYKIGNNYLNSRKCSLNGTETAWRGYANALNSTTHSATLFAANSIGTISLMATCKMWMASFSRGSAVTMQFAPVRVGTDATSWEGAMMDTLTRRIYRNQGTGAFGYGNDLPLETLAN